MSAQPRGVGKLTVKQTIVLLELERRAGVWNYPPRGYAHDTWTVGEMSVPQMATVMWQLARKDCVAFDHYYARDGRPRHFAITQLGRAYCEVFRLAPSGSAK